MLAQREKNRIITLRRIEVDQLVGDKPMTRIGLGFTLALSFLSPSLQADTIHNVATALDFAGFDARGSRNPLSGGVDLLINRQFNGNLFDFGGTEVALQGPISLQMSTGGRLLPEFDVSFSTSLNNRSQVSPLNFSYVSDIGPQSTVVTGSLLIDGDFSIDALGFYDLSITSSRRNTVTREGIVDDTGTFDSDLGPIVMSGNIFVDALGVLVDPLFEQTGRENPFTDLAKLIDLSAGPTGVANRNFDSMQPPVGLSQENGAVVPEPTVLVLLVLGLPVVINRTWRLR